MVKLREHNLLDLRRQGKTSRGKRRKLTNAQKFYHNNIFNKTQSEKDKKSASDWVAFLYEKFKR